MSDCLFCKIIAKTIPSNGVYEDENTYAFLDIAPVHPGHVLVVPKIHAANILEVGPEPLTQVIKTTQKIATSMYKSLSLEGCNITQNNGSVAGQSVHHLHIHIIPRYANDGLQPWSHKKYASQAEAAQMAECIRAGLQKS